MFSHDQHQNIYQGIKHKATSTTSLNSLGVIRKYMNGAVYVESSNGGEGFSNDLLMNSQEDNICLKRIKCSCISVDSNCDIHKKVENGKPNQVKKKTVTIKEDKWVGMKPVSSEEDLRLSLSSSVTTLNNPADDFVEKQLLDISFQNWTLKKNEEKKRIEEMQVQLKESEEMLRQKQLEQERENFRRWLSNKKKEEEEMKRAEREKEIQKNRMRDSHKNMRLKECDVRYRLWLKSKEQEDLEKKANQQAKLIEMTEERAKRLENNQRAFRSWLESSKDKQKPIPPGKGLDSKCCIILNLIL